MEMNFLQTKLSIIPGDITQQNTDAIVNAANSCLMGGGGVDGAIHRVGGPAIIQECREIVARIGRLPAGQAVITTAGNLKARHVIHTVGPIWQSGQSGEPQILASAYQESLKVAVENGLKSVSFPSISTGAYRYPIDQAARIALKTVIDFIQKDTCLEEVVLVLFDSSTHAVYIQTLNLLI